MLIGLSAVGVALVAFSGAAVMIGALRVRAHIRRIKSASIFFSLESLQLQGHRFVRFQNELMPLAERLAAVQRSISQDAAQSGVIEARDAVQNARGEVESLIEVLR